MMRRIRCTWHNALQRAGLWQPPTPHVRMWDRDMNYLATLQHPHPARYTWPWRCRKPHTTTLRTTNDALPKLGNVTINYILSFDEPGHRKLCAIRNRIATIATPNQPPHHVC
jgi:hypothetical protein